MTNRISVYNFVINFNEFYNNVIELLNEAYTNNIGRSYTDKVYDVIVNYKNEVERTLAARVLSVDKASKMLTDNIAHFVALAENCYENYELCENEHSLAAYKFLNSVVDCYNEFVNDLVG